MKDHRTKIIENGLWKNCKKWLRGRERSIDKFFSGIEIIRPIKPWKSEYGGFRLTRVLNEK